jgi:hypothetical protein
MPGNPLLGSSFARRFSSSRTLSAFIALHFQLKTGSFCFVAARFANSPHSEERRKHYKKHLVMRSALLTFLW